MGEGRLARPRQGGEGVVVLGALPFRHFAKNVPLSGGSFGKRVGGDLRGVCDWFGWLREWGQKILRAPGGVKIWSRPLLLALYGMGYRE